MKTITKFLLISFFTIGQIATFAGVPGAFNYQAVIRDVNGHAQALQPVYLRFQIYEAAVAGNLVYQEDFLQKSTDSYGVVNLQIGSGTSNVPLTSLNWSMVNYYINVQSATSTTANFNNINNYYTLLSSVPYAFYASKSDTAAYALHAPQTSYIAGSGISLSNDSIIGQVYSAGNGISISANQIVNTAPNQTVTLTAGSHIKVTGTYPNFTVISTDSTPAGAIIAFGGTIAPTGWLLCDGGSYSNAATGLYGNLYAAISNNFGGSGTNFNVPDLRGRFLRGVNGTTANNAGITANNDPDVSGRTANGNSQTNAPGSLQNDAFSSHNHSVSFGGALAAISASSGNTGFVVSASSAGTSSTGGNETRPKNVYVNYIIKY